MNKEILPPAFMFTSIIGFMISATYTFTGKFQEWFSMWGENAGISLGFTFSLIFIMMFIASIITMTPDGHDKF